MKPESKLKAKIANWQYAMSSMMKTLNKRTTAKVLRSVAKREIDKQIRDIKPPCT